MMVSYRKLRALPWDRLARLRHIAPVLAGSSMLCAGLLPWLNDPLGKVYSAWDLPVVCGGVFGVNAPPEGTDWATADGPCGGGLGVNAI